MEIHNTEKREISSFDKSISRNILIAKPDKYKLLENITHKNEEIISSDELTATPSNEVEVKQIEIVRGPSSSLYGNNAFAGVVNIITDEPKPGFKAELIGSYETHNTFDKNANISYRKNNFYSSIFNEEKGY